MIPPTSPAPTPTSAGIWLPLSLAIPMFACYFGDAPRYENRKDPSRPAPPPPVDDAEGDRPTQGPMSDPLAALARHALVPTHRFGIPRGRAPGAVPPAPPTPPTLPDSGTIPSSQPGPPPTPDPSRK